jgi:hypothetical protein
VIAILVLVAVVGCVFAQHLICRSLGLRGLAAATALAVGLLYNFWLQSSNPATGNPCEACRVAGQSCGACEALTYLAFGLGLAGVLLIVTGLIVGAFDTKRRRRA